MAKVLVKDLVGAALDWAVAQCEGYKENEAGGWYTLIAGEYEFVPGFRPTTDPAQAWGIIDRDGISVVRCDDDYGVDDDGYTTDQRIPVWCASKGQQGLETSTEHQSHEAMYQIYEAEVVYGPTSLVAAMRCKVDSVYGKEIDIPDELVDGKSADQKARDYAEAVRRADETGSAYMRAGDNGGVDPQAGKTKAVLRVLSDRQAADAERLRDIANGVPSESGSEIAAQPEGKVVVHVDGGCVSYVASSNPAIKVILHDADNLKAQGVSADRRDALLDAAADGCAEVEIIGVVEYLDASIPEATKAKAAPALSAPDAFPQP